MATTRTPVGTASDLLVVEHRLDARSFDIGWFPDEIADAAARRRCGEDLRAMELRWDPSHASDELWNEVQRRLERSAWATAKRLGWRLELVLLEAKAGPRSRIRSHKGLLRPLGLSSGGHALELEIPLPDGESILAASTAIGEVDMPIALTQAWDAARAVVLALDPKQPAPRETWIRALVASADLRGSVLLSQTSAIARLAPGVAGVLRLVHPASDSHLALVCFVPAAQLPDVRAALQAASQEACA